MVYKFDCSGKDIDVSADEVDPKKRFQFLSVYWAKETAQYLFVNYGMKNISRLGIYDKEEVKPLLMLLLKTIWPVAMISILHGQVMTIIY